MIQHFPKLFRSFGGDINVKVDLSNYATKADIKYISHVDTSSFALKLNLASLKTEVNKLDIDKLVNLVVSKFRNVVKNEVVKKTVYDRLVAKVNNIDTSGFVLKLNSMQIKQNQKRKFLILINLFKKQFITLKLVK